MLTAVISWSLSHRGIVLASAAMVSLLGYLALTSLNIDAFPDTTPVQVQINTLGQALVPEEVERLVTFPVEMCLGGLPGLESLRSVSQFGVSQVVVTFKDGTNIYFARQLINERLNGVELPPGIGRPEMGPVSTGLGEVFHEFPDEISHVWSRVGTPEVATDAGSLEVTDLFVALKPRTQWKQAHQQAELVNLMVQEVEEMRGQMTWFTQPIELRINEMVSGVRADVAVKIFGDDLEALIGKAQELQAVLTKIPGCSDLTVEQINGQPILRIALKQDELARYGIPARAVLDLVESIGSKVVGEVLEGQLRFPLVVRLPDHLREDPEAIGRIPLTAPGGEQLLLSRVADIKRLSGPKMITREWSQRRVTVQCNVRGRDIGTFVAEAQAQIARQVELPADRFRIEWGGQFENMQRAQQRLLIVVPLALCLIVLLLYLTFRNIAETLAVFASVPFACVGGILGLYIREMPLSISAAVGFITLSGVSVLSSMILVAATRSPAPSLHYDDDGAGPAATSGTAPRLVSIAVGCLRTILMTALVASVGFIPMAISDGTGAEVQRPLATVVIGGVISSTFFTLLVFRFSCKRWPTDHNAKLYANHKWRSQKPMAMRTASMDPRLTEISSLWNWRGSSLRRADYGEHRSCR